MESKIKIFISLFIPYAFFCAGLYQFAFWSQFGINGFSFLNFSDIILSFIQPFLLSSFFSLVTYPLNFYAYNVFPYGGGNQNPSKKKEYLWHLAKIIYIVLASYWVLLFEDKWKGLWLPTFLFIGIYFFSVEFLLKRNFIKHDKINFLGINLLIFLPLTAFSIGTLAASEIYKNTKFDYSVKILSNTPIKFLGKASNYYIFVSVDNKTKYFFSTEEVGGLILSQFKKE